MTTSLFICTHAKHVAFFELCARSIAKHATGFHEVMVVVPTTDLEAFQRFATWSTADGAPFRIRDRYEAPERGHIWMNATKCCADLYCPEADLIAHIDADSVFTRDITPFDYLVEGSIPVLVKEYADAGDALAWKPLVERALGIEARWETMQRPELAYWRGTYRDMRLHVEVLHRQPFLEYALTHHVPEFPTLGTYALQRSTDGRYFPTVNVQRFILQGWSHHADNPETLPGELARLEAAMQ